MKPGCQLEEQCHRRPCYVFGRPRCADVMGTWLIPPAGAARPNSPPPPPFPCAILHAGFGSKLLLGLVAGAAGQAVAVPADLVKVRCTEGGGVGRGPAPLSHRPNMCRSAWV